MIAVKNNDLTKQRKKSKSGSKKIKPPDQRSHFRLVCFIPASIKSVIKTSSGQIIPGEPHNITICNISGGGVRILTDHFLEIGDRVLVTFKLNDDILILTGEVRVKFSDPGSVYRYQYGVMFTGLSVKDQDIIYKYLFQEQTFRVLAD